MAPILDLFGNIENYLPILLAVLVLWLANYLLFRRVQFKSVSRLFRHLLMLGIFIFVVIVVILALPINEGTRSDLLSLLGLGLTVIIAFSSTSLVANAMAGFMLRSVSSFKGGDFIRVEDNFGRVTELGLFHTEIQTELRDLVTLPNLFLATRPVTVIRSSGTIISCDVSLGYDIPHQRVNSLLLEAAELTGLEESFVQIRELGDFAISYRVCGYYREVKQLLTMQTRLKEQVLDKLHGAEIEIVSPAFMNQRQVDNKAFFTKPKLSKVGFDDRHPPPETLIFDKADRAEKIVIFEKEQELLKEEIKKLSEEGDKKDKEHNEQQINIRTERINLLDKLIEKAKEKEN